MHAMKHPLKYLFAACMLSALVPLLTACERGDSPEQIRTFCDTLADVNAGGIDTTGLPELAGHARLLRALKENSPPSLTSDLDRIYRTIDDWARAVDGDHPMIDTFGQLSDPRLVGSEGRVADFAALHCGVVLGGKPWVEDEPVEDAAICPGWPRAGTPLSFNFFPNLPDIAGSNYFSNTFLISTWASRLGLETLRGAFVVEPGGQAVFRGQYPKARYFAYHPNDMDLNNLDTLRDIELEADPGSRNPFLRLEAGEGPNYYTATLAFSPVPEQPAANTSYVGERKNGGENRFVMNLMRLYHVDSGNGPGSGGVPLPELKIFDASGELVQHFPACDPFASGPDAFYSARRFPALPIIDHRATATPRWSTSSNFNAPSDTLANADVQYLSTHYSSRFGQLLVVRGKYLTAPDTRNGESPATVRQVRLYNLCTYNFWNGSAINCLLENQLRRDTHGYYTLVIAAAEDRPDNLQQQAATWLDRGPYLDGQLSYRFVYRENPYVQAIAAGVRGEPVSAEMADYVPRAVHCSRSQFEQGGWRACFDAGGRQR